MTLKPDVSLHELQYISSGALSTTASAHPAPAFNPAYQYREKTNSDLTCPLRRMGRNVLEYILISNLNFALLSKLLNSRLNVHLRRASRNATSSEFLWLSQSWTSSDTDNREDGMKRPTGLRDWHFRARLTSKFRSEEVLGHKQQRWVEKVQRQDGSPESCSWLSYPQDSPRRPCHPRAPWCWWWGKPRLQAP